VFIRKTPEDCAHVLEKFAITEQFFLYVGNAKQHKNIPLLFSAFKQLPPGSPSLVMLCGGKEAEWLTLPQGVRRIPSATDEELACLYSSAVAYVSSSLCEGFGLPVVEAQACGCPIVAIDAGAVREVALPSALLVPPDAPRLTQAMMDIQNIPRPTPLPGRSWDHVAQDVANELRSSLIHHG